MTFIYRKLLNCHFAHSEKSFNVSKQQLRFLHKVEMKRVISLFVAMVIFTSAASAVTTRTNCDQNASDFENGITDNVLVDSRGTLSLSRAAQQITAGMEGVWSVNCIAGTGDVFYAGTSPNGIIYKIVDSQVTQVYPQSADSNQVLTDSKFSNEHIFAMGLDIAGRLLAAVSGNDCRLMRIEDGQAVTIFKPKEADYIFAIEVSDNGTIYLGTGPKGKIYRLDAVGANAQEIFDAEDKNILSLELSSNGKLYAGTDTRGLVYCIDLSNGDVTVVYDSDQPEITSLVLHPDGDLYAAATNVQVSGAVTTKIEPSLPGRPEITQLQSSDSEFAAGEVLSLDVPTTAEPSQKTSEADEDRTHIAKQDFASSVYRISPQGYVTKVVTFPNVLYSMAIYQGKLVLGMGNSGGVVLVDPVSEEQSVIFKDKQVAQVTGLLAAGDKVYYGASNIAQIGTISSRYSSQGTFISDLIDAGEPAMWGKLHLEGLVPQGTQIEVTARSGNVKDANDPTYSPWSAPQPVTGPVQLQVPVARFCQYKLSLTSDASDKTPLVNKICVASTVQNLPPKINAVSVSRVMDTAKAGTFKINYQASDRNADTLIYDIDFRKIGRENWINLSKDHEQSSYDWEGRTVEEGKYEFRVTAKDERGNAPGTEMQVSRISDPVTVDYTGPVIEAIAMSTEVEDGKIVATLSFTASDEYSVVADVFYTVDSNAQWKRAIPQDFVYDSRQETFTIVANELAAGDHVIAVKAIDALGNTSYSTFDITDPKK